MDFGTLKNKFTQEYINSHINEDSKGKELYKEFLNIIKESDTLKSFFVVYKNLENKTTSSEFEAGKYLDENLSVLDKFRGEKSIVNECKKLVDLLDRYGIELNEKPNKLNESLYKLTTTSKSVEVIDVIHESKLNVIKHLMTEKSNSKEEDDLVRENIDVKKFLNIATQKYNEKYSTLTEEDKKMIKVVVSGSDTEKETLLKSMVKETLDLVNSKLVTTNLTLKEKLLETKDLIYNISESSLDNFSYNFKKLYDIKNIFK
jgi:hypothetical protein